MSTASGHSPSSIKSRTAEPDPQLITRLLPWASHWTGVSAGAIHVENIRRAASVLLAGGLTPQQILTGAEVGQQTIVESLRRAVSIGETYFFRHPEQFQLIEKLLQSAPAHPGGGGLRAWSAGCATGEEAYSIAALLNHLWAPGSPAPSVLGTDHLAAHIESARAGIYRRWSVRASGPIAYPLFLEVGEDRVAIRDELRAMVRFEVHSLLDPAPATGFDLIFCRNVLIYYDPPAIDRVTEHLVEALAPSGILVFGPSDPVAIRPGLGPVGSPELRVFTRLPAPREPRRQKPRSRVARPEVVPGISRSVAAPVLAPLPVPVDPVAMHLEVLRLMEVGEKARCESLLARIRTLAPDYLPACLEQALLHVRMGQQTAARACLVELLNKLQGLPDDRILIGPEPLAVSYYRAAGEALLAQGPGGERR